MSKYAGIYVPGMGGDDDEDESLSPSRASSEPSSHRVFSRQFDEYRRREEAKQRLAAWMNGREPVSHWEQYGERGQYPVLVMRFPTTFHHTVYAAEFYEYGKVKTFCEGCRVDDCAACLWARREYLTVTRQAREDQRRAAADAALPF